MEEESLAKIAEEAEADAWNVLEQSKKIVPHTNNTLQQTNFASQGVSATAAITTNASTASSANAGAPPAAATAPVAANATATAPAADASKAAAAAGAATATKARDLPSQRQPTQPTSAPEEEPTEPRKPRPRRNPEVKLIQSMQNTGEHGEDAVACVTHCRYGKLVRHPWTRCIKRCFEHALFQDTFIKMLPAELHATRSQEEALPAELALPDDETLQRIIHRIRQRENREEL